MVGAAVYPIDLARVSVEACSWSCCWGILLLLLLVCTVAAVVLGIHTGGAECDDPQPSPMMMAPARKTHAPGRVAVLY